MKRIIEGKFYLFVVGILAISFFLRFYNYENRFGLAYDQAHDAVLARYALEEHKLPLVGPFSSGARFQTSGIWYWFLMLSTLLYKGSFLTPWLVLTTLYAIFPGLVAILLSKVVNKNLGLLAGLIAAVSTAQLTQSPNITLTAPMSFVSLGTIYFMFLYVKKRNLRDLITLSFLCGLAPTIHLQGVLLTLFLPITLVFTRTKNIKTLIIAFAAFLIPFLPLLIFDLQNNFINSRGLINQTLYGQVKVSYEVLGRRWLTYLTVFWPNALSLIATGKPFVSYFFIVSLIYVFISKFLKRSIPPEWLILLSSFILTVFILRYVRNPLFDSYLVFLHPSIFIFSAWTILNMFKTNKFFAVFLFILLIIFSLKKDYDEIMKSDNFSLKEKSLITATLKERLPNTKFSVYSYKYKWPDKSLILDLYLSSDNLINENGRRVGVIVASKSGEFKLPILYGENLGYQIVDLQNISDLDLKKSGWGTLNPRDVYISTEEWYKK